MRIFKKLWIAVLIKYTVRRRDEIK